jgi:integrase
MWFKRRCLEAGIANRTMHGLRKAVARRLAEVGLSNQMIKSITGHTSDTEVARYTAAARQERMAETAF